MKNKIELFLKNNYPWLILAAYGFFLIFYKWSGSFMGDEATYSQVAKESLYDRSYFILHWKRALWMEKPPLIIWLTALAFKLWGISETSAHIFSGLFSIGSAIAIYFLAKNLFNSKSAGFFSGFVFLTTPLITLYTRVNMMDIPVGMFIAFSILALWKIINGKEKWWLIFGVSTSLAIMTKSVIGFLPVALAVFLAVIFKQIKIFKSKYFLYGIVLFFLISAPWHIFMSVKFGQAFWKDYLGYHIWDRFFQPILPYPWEGNNPWAYFKLFWLRSGIWFFIFSSLTLAILFDAVIKIREKYKNGSLKFFSAFRLWTEKYKKEFIFLYAWLAIVFLPFFFSQTKLPNYMVLSYFPLAIATGGLLAYIFKTSKAGLFIICTLSLVNFLPNFRLQVSDYGEAHSFLPKVFIRYLGFNNTQLIFIMAAMFITVTVIFLRFHPERSFIQKASLIILLSANTLVPFAPLRNEFIKNFAKDLAKISQDKPVSLLAIKRPDHFSFQCVGAFYLPLGSKIENLGSRKIEILDTSVKNNLSFCFVERGLENEEINSKKILSYPEGSVINCQLE